MPKPKGPCENCGSGSWISLNAADMKGALGAVAANPVNRDMRLEAGAIVDVWACSRCGLLRLFRIVEA